VFDFADLQALGRDKNNASASNDFTEADTAFMMSDSSDNIEATWSTDGTNPRENTSIDIYDRTIYNVSVTNSTDADVFVTGILWDTADSVDDEFGGDEDLVFVTPYKADTVGKYGTYGYETKVPGVLDTYKGTTDAVAFYVEIR